MKTAWRILGGAVLLMAAGLFYVGVGTNAASHLASLAPDQQGVIVGGPVTPGISPAVRDISLQGAEPVLIREINPRQNPLLLQQDPNNPDPGPQNRDPLIQPVDRNLGRTPVPVRNFEGLSSQGPVPPDMIGDVGPNHYVQMVNLQFAIYDKEGDLLVGPTKFNKLFVGQGGNCEPQNAGDPVVLYDPMADRWLLSQFAAPSHICIAISRTPDPTETYYVYEFNVLSFPDYFKFGVWPDGYYMSANETGGYTAYAFDRARMLQGQAATFQKFSGQTNLLLPADLDGATQPPAGSPNYFYTFKDGSFHGSGGDRLEVFAFDVDFAVPANSSFQLVATIPIASFNYTVCGFFVFTCIPQQGAEQRVDAVSEWPMWRLQYRNFGTHQTLVGNFTVDVNGSDQAGIRWFELRKVGAGNWALHQQGTHAPDSHNRWMGSIAMDKNGHIALGYSASSATMHPAIRYATRLATDPPGTLQVEASIIEGGGSQTIFNRWGDYSSMNVDPVDDCTFWYTSEYYSTISPGSWRTRVGVFKIPPCEMAPTPNMMTIYIPFIMKSTTPTPPTCTPDPPGESSNVVDALTICSGQTVSGQVNRTNDMDDVYKIPIQAGQQLTIAMNGAGGDADLYLYPPDTTDIHIDAWVENSINLNNNEFIQTVIPANGFWYIDVRSFSGSTAYNLTVTIANPLTGDTATGSSEKAGQTGDRTEPKISK